MSLPASPACSSRRRIRASPSTRWTLGFPSCCSRCASRRASSTTRTPGGAKEQLLVRVYPDECQVDGFEPDLSDAEVTNLRRYWCAVWSAGGDESHKRAAWRELCAAHGAGRAMYLSRRYVPLGTSDAVPARGSSSAIILAVALDAPIQTPNEKAAVANYWTAVWRAGSNATAIAAAFATLRGIVGDARAAEIVQKLAPFNIKERPQPNVDRATVAVSIVFVVMTPASVAATKRVAWTRPPRAAVLPERFVLFADSGAEHVEVLGGMITQPLHVGPDPLASGGDQFSSASGDIVGPAAAQMANRFLRRRDGRNGFPYRPDAASERAGVRSPLRARRSSHHRPRRWTAGAGGVDPGSGAQPVRFRNRAAGHGDQ